MKGETLPRNKVMTLSAFWSQSVCVVVVHNGNMAVPGHSQCLGWFIVECRSSCLPLLYQHCKGNGGWRNKNPCLRVLIFLKKKNLNGTAPNYLYGKSPGENVLFCNLRWIFSPFHPHFFKTPRVLQKTPKAASPIHHPSLLCIHTCPTLLNYY